MSVIYFSFKIDFRASYRSIAMKNSIPAHCGTSQALLLSGRRARLFTYIYTKAQELLLSGRLAALFTYIYTKGGKGHSVDVCLT